ncbi:hypothetical protein Anas_13201 [Armadillidium nasatum]|uniref:Uncharacterized protein n=1 Tax=Armadillidium nasatum TaxID=96803 RepID=A0A5N5SRB5_9CRUS|nr:hypothetical protein Anas_13201 [Armadillidium nasatum]
MNEESESLDNDHSQVVEPDIFDSSESDLEENDFLGFEINSPLSIDEYVSLGSRYSQVRIPDITVPVTTRLETFHISPFQNINRTPTITSMHTTLVVPGCQSVETCSSGNQVVGESAVEDRVNEMYERDSNSTINSTIGNNRRMSADFAILRFLCRSTGESVVSDNGFTEGRGNIRDIRDILNPNSSSYNLGFPEDTLSSIGEHSETMECTLDEYIEDSYILSPELEMRTKVVDTIVTTTISNVVGPRTRSHGPVPDHIHVLTNPLEYKRKFQCSDAVFIPSLGSLSSAWLVSSARIRIHSVSVSSTRISFQCCIQSRVSPYIQAIDHR